jgi:DNA-binding HxlR family transcriptional regulator
VHHHLPPKVEYGLTDWGQALCAALDALLHGAATREREQLTVSGKLTLQT